MEEMSQEAKASSTQANTSETRPIYEVAFHVVPTVAEDGVGAVVDGIRKLLGNAEIISEQAPTKITFAYVIERATSGKREKYSEGYFGWIKFATEKENIPAFQEALRATREVLRYMVISTVREDAQPQRRAVFTSDRLEGETLKKPEVAPEVAAEVSEADLDKSIDALVS